MVSEFGFRDGPELDYHQVIAVMDWLLRNAKPTKTIRPHTNSYWLKHLVENDIGEYVGNGVVIQALINLGWKIKRTGVNCRSACQLLHPRAFQRKNTGGYDQ